MEVGRRKKEEGRRKKEEGRKKKTYTLSLNASRILRLIKWICLVEFLWICRVGNGYLTIKLDRTFRTWRHFMI
jgi:hypothetical protein